MSGPTLRISPADRIGFQYPWPPMATEMVHIQLAANKGLAPIKHLSRGGDSCKTHHLHFEKRGGESVVWIAAGLPFVFLLLSVAGVK